MIVVAANSGLPSPPGWYFNLRAGPRAMVEVGDRTLDVRAEKLSADEAAAFWPRLLQVAPDYARYPKRTSRRIRLMRAVYAGHRLDDARQFVDRFRDVFATRPVWLFSSGPVGDPSRKLVQKIGGGPPGRGRHSRCHKELIFLESER